MNPVSAIGASALFAVGAVVMKNEYVSGVGADECIFRKPYKVKSWDAKANSHWVTGSAGYGWGYDLKDNNANNTGGIEGIRQNAITSFASAILKAQISVSQWTSTAV